MLLGAAGPPPNFPPVGASSCSGCHGSASPLPALAGRNPSELVAILEGYRAGTRSSTVMGRIVRGFSQDETLAIATWLAAEQ
jgi:cytochrome c553